jgi:UDP-GlcNAc3NAcA epimerase
MKKILTVIGPRPQVIKSAAITRVVRDDFRGELEEVVVHTGQHFDANMSSDFYAEMFLPIPRYQFEIDVSEPLPINQMIQNIQAAVQKESPDALLVYGDTNSTLAGTISAIIEEIPLIHVEAGMRSFNMLMPEEGNRILTDHSSDLLFSSTKIGVLNLKKEKFNSDKVKYCGDVMFDNSLFYEAKAREQSTILTRYNLKHNEFNLFTCHRGSNTDDAVKLRAILEGVIEIKLKSGNEIVFPMHPRTEKMILKFFGPCYLDQLKSEILVIPPASYLDVIMLECNSNIVITDSGGIQKEAYFFKKKSLILRGETEWGEILDNQAAILFKVNEGSLIQAYDKVQKLNPNFKDIYGDGKAGEFICNEILELLK